MIAKILDKGEKWKRAKDEEEMGREKKEKRKIERDIEGGLGEKENDT